MAISLTTITNTSKQVVPVLVSSTAMGKTNVSSDLRFDKTSQLSIAPGAQIAVETARLDLGQLQRLQNLSLIKFSST